MPLYFTNDPSIPIEYFVLLLKDARLLQEQQKTSWAIETYRFLYSMRLISDDFEEDVDPTGEWNNLPKDIVARGCKEALEAVVET